MNFINSGQSLHITTLETLKTYMVYQEQQTDAMRRKKNKEGTRNQGQGRNNSQRSNSNASSTNSNRKLICQSPMIIRKRGNELQMTTTVPFMGQYTNGVSVTKINMVTTSDPVIKMKLLSPFELQSKDKHQLPSKRPTAIPSIL